MSSVCRVCLAGNTKLQTLRSHQLKDIYEKLSNKKFNSEDARPRALCCYCYQKLLRCHTFSQMSIKSEQMFSDLFLKGLEATYEYITKPDAEPKIKEEEEYITEVNIGIKHHLTVTPMPSIIIDSSINNADSQVVIKHEQIPSVDTKEEMATEQDILVKVESAPEYCTKRQLKFEESDPDSDVEEFPSNSDEQTAPDEPNRTFICNDCNKLFFVKHLLLLHIRNVHYPLIGQQFTHVKKYTAEISMIKDCFPCNVCHKQFNSQYEVLIHKRNSHIGEKPRVACRLCGKEFRQKSNLIHHILIVHTAQWFRALGAAVIGFREGYDCRYQY